MSYDFWVEMDAGGEDPMTAGSWNYTYNCARMFEDAIGYPLRDIKGKIAGDVAPDLQAGAKKMREEIERYREMNPENGWGDADGAAEALQELADLFTRHPKATIGAWL